MMRKTKSKSSLGSDTTAITAPSSGTTAAEETKKKEKATPGIDEMIQANNADTKSETASTSSTTTTATNIPQSVVEALREELTNAGTEHGRFTDLDLKRWLINRKTIPNAVDGITKHVEWRRDNNADTILNEPITDAELQIQIDAQVFEFLPDDVTDPNGRPIVIVNPARHTEKCGVGKVDIKKFLIYYQEYMTQLLNRVNSQEFVAIMDLKGCKIKHFDYSIAKSIGDINRKNYPERLGKVFVINYPMFYHVVWFVVRNWLAKKTQTKIKFKDSKKIDMDYILQHKKIPEDFQWK